jgi:hypothetical protein
MARWPAARWEPLPRNVGGALRPIAVTLHHQVGFGNPAPVYLARGVSAHFWIPRSGQPVQHVDTARVAWHAVRLNSTSIGVEVEGCANPPYADPMNENQLRWFGGLMAWANRTHGIPLQLSEAWDVPGLNYHRCRGGPPTGCPCAVRVNQRAEILRRARGTTPAPGPPAPKPPAAQPPPFNVPAPGYISVRVNSRREPECRQWQQRMRTRGWTIGVDGVFGSQSESVLRQYQNEKRLRVDGLLGPVSFRSAWTAPVT